MFPQASARTRSVYGTTCWRRESCAYLQQDIVKCCVSEGGASLLNDWLGGLLGLFFAIDELNADDDLGDEFKALESTPMLLGFQGEFKDHRQGRDP